MEPKQTVNVRLCAEYINHVKVQIDITKISSSTSYCIMIQKMTLNESILKTQVPICDIN